MRADEEMSKKSTGHIENNTRKSLNPLNLLQSDNEQHNYNAFLPTSFGRVLWSGIPNFNNQKHSFSLMEISFTIISNYIQL